MVSVLIVARNDQLPSPHRQFVFDPQVVEELQFLVFGGGQGRGKRNDEPG